MIDINHLFKAYWGEKRDSMRFYYSTLFNSPEICDAIVLKRHYS